MPDLPLWAYASVGGFIILVVALIVFQKKKTASRATKDQPLTLGLEKTRKSFSDRLNKIIRQEDKIGDHLLSELEALLIQSDVGVNTTQKLLEKLKDDVSLSGHSEIHLLKEFLRQELHSVLHCPEVDLEPAQKPHVTMVVGVNGVGKTTSIGKLAQLYRREGNQVMLAAADTFRAGAVDQLKVWGERVDAQVLAQKEGADPAAVAFDAVQSAMARQMDRVVIDTAGRLHTKVNLMEELKKVKRVLGKAMAGAPHEILLVLDATQGQNALHQARQFHEALGLTGIILTKLDSTSKGGIVVGIVDELGVPIAYIGVGEAIEDLRVFKAEEFVDAILV